MRFSTKAAPRLAWGSVAVSTVLAFGGVVVLGLAGPASPEAPRTSAAAGFPGIAVAAVTIAGLLVFSVVGALIASRRPENALGWLFCSVGLLFSLNLMASSYAYWGIFAHPGSLPGVDFGYWIGQVFWLPSIPLTTSFLFLLFPSGQLPSPRWKPVLWATIAGAAIGAIGGATIPTLYGIESIPNPVYAAPGDLGYLLTGVGFFVVIMALIASVVGLILRFRRSLDDERQQVKWFASAAVLVIILGLPEIFLDNPPIALQVLAGLTALGIPVSVAVAILKYRLYDIDVVINKTVVYGALAAFVTGAYVGVVVGIGALFGRGDRPNVALSILATAIVAVAFQPVRERVKRLANRLVYGKRATPYEVLSEFSERMGETYATWDLIPRMARILAEGTGAARADVWLKVGSELRLEASWPHEAESRPPIAKVGDELPHIDGVDRTIPVAHQGELLGALAITKKPGEAITPTEAKLADDLAAQAGLVLRNVGLTEELKAKLEELRASRQRLVSAQDEERRRIERNIHDGAQQQLVSLAVKLRLLQQSIARDATKASELAGQLQTETNEALENLRDLARGIYPPLLADKGLSAALEAQARKVAVPVTIEANGVGRYPQEIEAAAYFCCLEALQNVAKYANASSATIRLRHTDDALTFSVEDEGRGFDPATTLRGSGLTNMTDRLDALGGSIEIRSELGSGTSVTGRVPARALEPSA